MMKTQAQTTDHQLHQPLASKPIHTTLYDLIAAISDEAGLDADHIVTATMIHILKSYRVFCDGAYGNMQILLDEENAPYNAVA